MNQGTLKEIGLSDGESKVYIALIQLGATTTGPLTIKAGVSSSKVYKILDRLEKKGLVGKVNKQGVNFFNAMSPQRILEYIGEKENELKKKKEMVKQLVPEWELERKLAKKSVSASLFQGLKSVTNVFRTILDELYPGDTYDVIGGGYGEDIPGLRSFFFGYHKRRAAKGIKLRMLANSNINKNIEQTTRLKAKIKFLPPYLLTTLEIVLFSNKTFIVVWSDEPKGFLIEDQEATKGFRLHFEELWRKAEE